MARHGRPPDRFLRFSFLRALSSRSGKRGGRRERLGRRRARSRQAFGGDLERDRRHPPRALRARSQQDAHGDGADYIICFMEDIYTRIEKTLIEAGRFEAVQATRSAFQDTMRERFSAAVEELSGRKVVGFLSQVHVDPDLSVETFILEAPQA